MANQLQSQMFNFLFKCSIFLIIFYFASDLTVANYLHNYRQLVPINSDLCDNYLEQAITDN